MCRNNQLSLACPQYFVVRKYLNYFLSKLLFPSHVPQGLGLQVVLVAEFLLQGVNAPLLLRSRLSPVTSTPSPANELYNNKLKAPAMPTTEFSVRRRPYVNHMQTMKEF